MDNYHFINNGEYIISETTKYPTYTIKKKTKNFDKNSFLLDSPRETICIKSQNDLLYKNNQNNKRVIIVDDERDILFTYRSFLKDYNYNITCFDDPSLALNYVREIQNSENLVIILDIRMKNLNGLQLYQQIKAIDPTIKIIFITALDILDELLSVVPGISKEQIMRKPVDKKEFTNTVNKLLT
jgi:CheY-like chemotaxis protein